jgi:two-component system, OmpR family, sensor histidine kinase PhoQ
MGSISRRLLVSVTLLLVLFFGVMVAVLDARFRTIADHALQDLLDAQIVALIASAEPDQAGNLIPRLQDAESQLATPGSGLYAGVQQADGEVIWRSPSAIGSLESFGPPQPPGHRSFHALHDARGQSLAAVSRGVEWEGEAGGAQRLTFSVAASLEGRDAQIRDFRRGLLGGFALLTAGLLVALALLLRWALQPLRGLARQIRQVEAGGRDQLDEHWPTELTRVVANLNKLLQSERTRIARYRDTLGNLAHSLKTPLAVLRSSIREGSVPASVVDDQVERMSRIVEHQLRRAARSGAAGVGAASIPVLPVVQDLRATMLKVHRDKDFALHLAVPAEAQFTGDRDDLLEALGNLMDNAAKWCRGQVRVSATVAEAGPAEQGLRLVVEDDGPGIAARDRQLVRERGARVDEQVPGHGLGLSMVGEMVDLYGGRLLIDDSPLGGARVELQLPGRLR